MKDRFLTIGSWAFGLAFIAVGLDGWTFGALGVGKSLANLVAPIRTELSLAAQCAAVVIFGAMATLPIYICLLPLTIWLKSDKTRAIMAFVVALAVSAGTVFLGGTSPAL